MHKLQVILLFSLLLKVLPYHDKCSIDDHRNPQIYRLGESVLPVNYNISLIFNENFNKSLKFEVERCAIQIVLNPKRNQSSVKTIRFHYNSTIANDNVTLVDKNGRYIGFNISNFDLCSQIIDINLLEEELEMAQEPYTLTFANLIGGIRKDNFGVYLGDYRVAGEEKYFVATEFQAAKARFNFPCFDEPALKATFDMSITAPKSYNSIIGNTKIISEADLTNTNTRITTFNTTLKISTYMVGYVISSFESASAKGHLNFKVYYAESRSFIAQYALYLLPNIIEKLENIFGIKYEALGNSQLHQVALPEIAAATTEYWGMNFYRESVLLHSKTFSTNIDCQKLLTYMGFALSLHWVGNYATINWWSQLWIVSGTAKYFSFHATADVEPDRGLKDIFIIEVIQRALEKDGIFYDMPLTSQDDKVLHWKEINQKSILLTEEKGASIIRMIAHIIGKANFEAAYQKFLQKFKYSNANASDFIQAFEEQGLPKDTMTEWTELARYPTVTVKKLNNSAVLTQKIFSNERHKLPTEWHIPITFASSAHNREFTNTTPTHWLRPNEELVLEDVFANNTKWIIVNVQVAGFYRVNYEESLWPDILTALHSDNYGGISAISRAQLIDDVLNMARTMRQSYNLAMDVTKYLSKETEYYPWAAAYNAFEYLLIRIGNRTELNSLVKRYIIKLLQNLLYPKPYVLYGTESHIEILKKVLHIEWSCRCGIPLCIETARKLFEVYKADPINFVFKPNVHYAIFCNAIRYGTESDWNILYEHFKLSKIPTVKKQLLNALGCSRNPSILMRFLEQTIDPKSTIRKQDCYKIFRAVVKTNVDVAYEFFKLYISDISYQFASYNALTVTLELLTDRFSTIAQIEDFKRFVHDNHNYFHEADGRVIQGLVKTAEMNIKWLTTFEDELTEWLTQEVNNSYRNKFSLSLVVCSLMIFVINSYTVQNIH